MDAVVLYKCSEGVAEIAGAVQKLQQEGLSVRAEKSRPENIRYRQLYILEKGELRREEASC